MRIAETTGTSLRVAVITMRRWNAPLTFVLVPMTHVARPQFYSRVRALLKDCDLIVAEGIRGRGWQVGALTMSYRLMPRWRRGGLVLQDYKKLLPPGVPVIWPDVTAAVAIADLRTLGRWLYSALVLGAPVAGLVALALGPRMFVRRQWTREVKLPPTRYGVRMPHLNHDRLDRAMLDRRDRMLVDALGRIDEQRRNEPIKVAVVYGAAHIPAAYAALLVHHGYRPRATRWLTAIVG